MQPFSPAPAIIAIRVNIHVGGGVLLYDARAWDVYSFAVVAAEVLLFRRATVAGGGSANGLAARAHLEGWRPELPTHMRGLERPGGARGGGEGGSAAAPPPLPIPPAVLALVRAGWDAEPAKRPAFAAVSEALVAWRREAFGGDGDGAGLEVGGVAQDNPGFQRSFV